jgi:uncharacterized protein
LSRIKHNARMRSSYDAQVAEPVGTVWASLTDVDSVLAALPGSVLSRDGDTVSGSVKCKLGSSQVTYRVRVRAEVGEAMFHTAVIAVTGKEARGSGTIAATLTVALRDERDATRVEVSAEIEASGRAEAADEQAWARVLETLVTAVVAPPPLAPAQTPSRPPLTVAPPPADVAPSYATASDPRSWMILGLVGIVLVVLARRLLTRRR